MSAPGSYNGNEPFSSARLHSWVIGTGEKNILMSDQISSDTYV